MKNFNETEIITMMRGAGFQDRHIGTAMIREALKHYERGMMITKDLYPAVAKEFGCTACAVERNMRFAIKEAHSHCWDRTRQYITGYGDNPNPVGEVLARLATWMEFGV